MTREEFQKTVSERFTNTDNGFGNMTQRELILLQIASNVYDGAVKNCSIPNVGKRCSKCDIEITKDAECPLFDDCPNSLPYQH